MIIAESHPSLPETRKGPVPRPPDTQAKTDSLDSVTCHEMVVIIRPSFKKFCGADACRAALFNHLLYWIARRAKGQETDKIKNGEVYWYGTAEEIGAGLDHSWSVNKVRKEIKALVDAGLIGQRHNPVKGWDQTRHYFFGVEQGQVLRDLCAQHGINLLELGLCAEVLHLLNLVNAFDKSGKCNSQICEMDLPNLADASTKSGNAIPKDYTKVTTKDFPKRESSVNQTEATSVAAHAPASVSDDVKTPQIITANVDTHEQQQPVPQPVTAAPTVEETGSKANKQSSTMGKSSERAKSGAKPKTSQSRHALIPSPEAALLLDAWDEINGQPLTRPDGQVEAAEQLAKVKATKANLQRVRDRLLAQKDGYWQSRGVSLKNVVNNFHLAAGGPMPPLDGSQASTTPPSQSVARPVQTASADKNQPRKLLRRIPPATQGQLLPTGTQPEARRVQ